MESRSLGQVRGIVVDLATGAPLSRVLIADVTDDKEGASVVTGPDGSFELALPGGRAGSAPPSSAIRSPTGW